jgi:pSer/pThr/pTyr-binding forkhead associated (FHA) protein
VATEHSTPSQYALRFISGKYQGGEFPLRMEREIVIGRSSDLDMVLVEDMVSRKHAKIATTGGSVVIQDLGSTNGTFVNGEKVKKIRLKEGDRILIGTSIIKLVSVDPNSVGFQTEAEARAKLESNAARRSATSGAGRPMSGTIEEIPLPDLLQLLSTSKKSGVVTVRSGQTIGRVYLRKGQVYYATIDDNFTVRPDKALFRMLTWNTGSFELEAPDDRQVMEELTESTEALLMEGMRQLDEIRQVAYDLPPPGSRLAVPTPLAGKLRELPPEQLDIFQLVLDHGSLNAVLDAYEGSDLEAYRHLAELLRREFVVVT